MFQNSGLKKLPPKQARIDSGKDNIIGLNAFKSEENFDIDTLDVDNNKVRESQIEKLNKIKKERDQELVNKLLTQLERCAQRWKRKSTRNKYSMC